MDKSMDGTRHRIRIIPQRNWHEQIHDSFTNLLPQISWVWVAIIILFISQWVRAGIYYYDQNNLEDRLDRIEQQLGAESERAETP